MGGQAAFASSHLMDSPSDDLGQTYKGSLVHGVGVIVVPWCREETRPFREEELPHPLLEDGIGVIH